jgi:dsRNA-specific ribonuclease
MNTTYLSLNSATLTLDSASQHLEHFCSKLPKVAYVDEPRPEFVLIRAAGVGISAKVILPTFVDTELRQFSGSLCKTERMAKREAAFQAYLGLYRAGLVNDNLLPAVVPEMQDAMSIQIESRESMCQTTSRLNPWREIATSFDMNEVDWFTLRVDITGGEQQISSVLLVLPRSLKTSLQIPLLWAPSSTFAALVTPSNEDLPASFKISIAQKVTHHLLKTIYGRKMQHQDLALDGYPCMIVPAAYVTFLKEWLDNPLAMMPEDDKTSRESHLVRRQNYNIPYFFREATGQNGIDRQVETRSRNWARIRSAGSSSESNDDESGSENCNMVDIMRLPKRVDFLHPAASDNAHTAWEAVPWSECSIESLSAPCARMMLFIPSILHVIGIGLVSQNAVDTVLSPIGFKDPKHVMTALTASAAHEFMNYQSLEFLGDSLLKYYTSLQLFAQFPKWHEGYLSRKKDSIVGNARLCRAALDVGLDRFIHTEPFAGAQWKVHTNASLRGEPDDQSGRYLSTKVLADVVEALIGAAHIDGIESQESERRSLACLRLFLPEVPWNTVQSSIARCQYPRLPANVSVSYFAAVEAMIGYQFENHMLIAEALTHPSAIDKLDSYQRLEYLGDAILDHIVVTTVFRAADKMLKPLAMHLIRTAIVNADFLAFLCLETTIDLKRFDVATDNLWHKSNIMSRTERKYLCQFMTTAGNALMSAQHACIKRHRQLREKIKEAIQHGASYPWSLLIRLRADKFFSDIIESILGAIYLDSRGSIRACEGFLRRIGLVNYLQRLITEPSIELMHPKEKLGVESGNAKLAYETSIEKGEDGEVRYIGKVMEDGDVFAISGEGFSKLEVETRAAELAVARIAAGKQLSHNAGEI